jgi:hypothetical protein
MGEEVRSPRDDEEGRRPGSSLKTPLNDGHHDSEGRPRPFHAAHVNPSAVFGYCRAADGEAQTDTLQLRLGRAGRRPLSLRGEERRENPRQVLHWNTATGILHLEIRGVPGAARSPRLSFTRLRIYYHEWVRSTPGLPGTCRRGTMESGGGGC